MRVSSRSVGGEPWELDHHHRSAAGPCLYRDVPLVGLGDGAYDGEAESGAAGATAARRVGAVKAFENAIAFGSGDTGTVAFDFDAYPVGVSASAKPGLAQTSARKEVVTADPAGARRRPAGDPR